MKMFKIGVKRLSESFKERIKVLPLNEYYKEIKSIAKDFDSYSTLKNDFRLAFELNQHLQSGKSIVSIEQKKKGLFTEFIISF